LATISTDMTSPISANARTNGSMTALAPVACALAASHDEVPSIASAGKAAASAATSLRICPALAAVLKRYSSWAVAGDPARRSAATCAGTTQAPAVAVIDLA
jgi:hypothetical protein